MTKEELINIGNMTFKDACDFLNVDYTVILAKNLYCIKCPLFRNGCDSHDGWYTCKSVLERVIKNGVRCEGCSLIECYCDPSLMEEICKKNTKRSREVMENKYAKYIRATLDNRTLLEQLAEECSELSKASLKLIRAMGRNNNVTPVSPGQAMDNFREEIMDVLAVLTLIEGEDDINNMVDNIPYNPKLRRWAERLGYKE